MNGPTRLNREIISAMVLLSLQEALALKEHPPEGELQSRTQLIDPNEALDSVGLVTLIIDLEQKIDEEYGVALTLADDRAMSQKNSPFRTVEPLTNYLCLPPGCPQKFAGCGRGGARRQSGLTLHGGELEIPIEEEKCHERPRSGSHHRDAQGDRQISGGALCPPGRPRRGMQPWARRLEAGELHASSRRCPSVS